MLALSKLTHSLKKEPTPTQNTGSKRYSLKSVASSLSHATSTPQHYSGIRFKKCDTEKNTFTFIYDNNGKDKEKTISLDSKTKLCLYINNLKFVLENDLVADGIANNMLIYFYEINNFLDKNNNKLDISKMCILHFDEFNYSKAKLDNRGKLRYGDKSTPYFLQTYIFYEERKPTETNSCTGNIAVAIYLPYQEKPLLLLANNRKYLNKIFFDKNDTTNKYYNKNNITLNELLKLPNVALVIKKTGSTPDKIIKDFNSETYSDYYFENIGGKLHMVKNKVGRPNKLSTIGANLSSENTPVPEATNNRNRKISMSEYLSLTKKEPQHTRIVNFIPSQSMASENQAIEENGTNMNTGSTRGSMNTGSTRGAMNTGSVSGRRTTKHLKGKPNRPAPPTPLKNQTNN